MDRAALIDAALLQRNYAGHLRRRIERLLDGDEDRTRLRCCNSGCFLCTDELLKIVAEVEDQLKMRESLPGNAGVPPAVP